MIVAVFGTTGMFGIAVARFYRHESPVHAVVTFGR